MLASIMQALDNTIANVALPRIQGSLSATQDQMTWVLTSYIIAAAIMTPLSGWLAGQIGRKRVFLFSIVGFTIASALCGLAQSLPEIVLARLFQGLCGAALIPMSQAVLLDINPPEEHAKAMAIWVTAVTIGPILGPALGGWLTENYNWRWVFYINVPFGILAFLGILTFMPETQLRKSRFDFFGFTALSLAIGSFQLMLDRGQLKDWFSSTEIWIEAVDRRPRALSLRRPHADDQAGARSSARRSSRTATSSPATSSSSSSASCCSRRWRCCRRCCRTS